MKRNDYKNIYKIYDLSKHYDLMLFDVWGVLIDSSEHHPKQEVVEVMNAIIGERPVYLVTNAPRTTSYVKSLIKGIKIEEERIITSGEMTISMLKKSYLHFGIENPKVFILDLKDHKSIIENSKAREVFDIEDADIIVLAVHSVGSIVQDHDKNLKTAAKMGIPVVVANPDKILSTPQGIKSYLAGTYAEIYKKFGGNNLVYIGKPYPDIFRFAIKEANMDQTKNKILMIGDTVDMDILGSKNIGIDSGLTVKTGNAVYMSSQHKADSYLEQCESMCKNHNAMPTYFVEF